jgi:bifunctional NMN adenylyltransferase/nudix hydrolase
MRLGVFIGRFQPFHSGHEHVVKDALTKVDQLLILVGSSFAARSARNPWTFEERCEMITACFRYEVAQGKLIFGAVPDHPSDERWLADVRAKASGYAGLDDEICLVGFSKDKSSFYLNMFPDWSAVDIEAQWRVLSATDIRHSYFSSMQRIESAVLPAGVCDFLDHWRSTAHYYKVYYEHEAIERYKESWKSAPFPPVFVTVDAVVVQSGHLLLVRRGNYPGMGLLALPGGFIDQHERIRDAAVRELKEETQISETQNRKGRVAAARLESYITETKVFDNPYRSARGRTITHAHLFRLPDAKPLWSVIGSDDAASAEWYPLDDLTGEEFFEDHFAIIQDMLGL